MEQVRNKSLDLPKDGVPPEVIHLLPYDNHLDKVQIQKNATPVVEPQSLTEAGVLLSQQTPNAVVMEKSCEDEGDVNARRISALRELAEKLHDETKETLHHKNEVGCEPFEKRQRKKIK